MNMPCSPPSVTQTGPTALICLKSSITFYFSYPWVLSGPLASSSSLSCSPAPSVKCFYFIYCFCSHLHVTLSNSHSDSISKSEKEKESEQRFSQTKSLTNTSLRPVSSVEVEFQLHSHHGVLSLNGFETSWTDARGHRSSANMSAEIPNGASLPVLLQEGFLRTEARH